MSSQSLSAQTMKRLLYTKKLLLAAEEHKHFGTELDRVFSILLCDNAIEMLLKTIATEKGINLDKNGETFRSLWTKIDRKITPKLPLTSDIFNLREERNLVQHQGAIPSQPNVDRHLNYARSFIEQVVSQQFNKNFDEIYLSDLIEVQEFRDKLKEIEHLLETGNFNEVPKRSIEFFILMLEKSEVFKHWYWPSIDPIHGLSWEDLQQFPIMTMNGEFLEGGGRAAGGEPALAAIFEALDSLKDFAYDVIGQFKILSIVPDYAEYSRFKLLTPRVSIRYLDLKPKLLLKNPKPEYTKEEAQFLFDFILKVSLKLQELQQLTS